jgi:thiamine-monophosphate kinase
VAAPEPLLPEPPSSERSPSAPLGEFERIARYFAPLAAPGALGLRDDAAFLPGPDGDEYVLTADAIVEGVHFRPDDPPMQVAQKLLRVNLSDIAAKGAWPVGYLLTTSLPRSRGETWLEAFAAGLAADQAHYGIGLLGGDSTATTGPAVLSLTALGRVASGCRVLRSGARPGDLVYVSGTLGDAALGLRVLEGAISGLDPNDTAFLADRYRLPRPRLTLGAALVGLAHAMADISDGLLADLGHIADVSGVAAVVEAERVPLSAAATSAIARAPRHRQAPFSGGDDYELVFAAPAEAGTALDKLAREAGVPITAVGRFTTGAGVRLVDGNGAALPIDATGWRHF